jgi:DNA-binding ferritin-like protein (Dps family)
MFSTFISKVVGEKGQWREYKARARQLPASYRMALDALERYLRYFGTGGGGTAIYEDVIDLFEQSAANGTPIREIVGEDPGVHRGIRPELSEGAVDHPGAGAADQRDRARRRRNHLKRRAGSLTAAQLVPAIRVQGLQKSYKQLHVLRGVDLDVARGSISAYGPPVRRWVTPGRALGARVGSFTGVSPKASSMAARVSGVS